MNFKVNYNTFRIRCIMLIVEKLNEGHLKNSHHQINTPLEYSF